METFRGSWENWNLKSGCVRKYSTGIMETQKLTIKLGSGNTTMYSKAYPDLTIQGQYHQKLLTRKTAKAK